ncbi:MAG: FHA domain-containing protein [Lachnospiraceae bacterium]|nr:FHA domain-containing protein [Lachnospiraceae bacterium]
MMIVSEYVRGLKNNYVRIRELSLPDERKYQYCIMKRGGITGLLPFEIRYIDSDAYMYYDITSRQNISTLYAKKPLDRNWVISFFSSMKRIRSEAVRFLLDPSNLIWNPGNVYQDLKTGNFGYLYVPYLDEDNGFSEMVDFIVGHVDYEDEELVRCVYLVAEQYKSSGDAYIDEKIYLDIEELKNPVKFADRTEEKETSESNVPEPDRSGDMKKIYSCSEAIGDEFTDFWERPVKLRPEEKKRDNPPAEVEPKSGGIISFFSRIRNKDRKLRKEYEFESEAEPDVAEEIRYSDAESPEDEDSEGTVFVDLSADDGTRRLNSENGECLRILNGESVVIGKKGEDADLVIDEKEISRMHARVFLKDEDYYIEDLNSTNGTFKNGVRLKPYEQKKLTKGDEIKLATKKLTFT